MRRLLWALFALPLTAPAQPGPPLVADRERVLKTVGEYARGYIQHLPDFVCVRVTKHNTRKAGATEWKEQVKVAEELSYYSHQEHYRVVAVNDAPAHRVPRFIAWSGFVRTAGNFGDSLNALFSPDSDATFEWKGLEIRDGRRAWVFSYRMPSGYTSKWCSGVIIPTCKTSDYPYHGLLYISDRTEIMRLTIEVDNAPPRDQGSQSTDYGRVPIGSADYLLPTADTYERLIDKTQVWNESVYRDYRKFGAESMIRIAPDRE
jgi:hypothetical protein